MKLLKQSPFSVWFHDTVTLVPFTTGSAIMGDAAVSRSVQVELVETHNEHKLHLVQPMHSGITVSVASVQKQLVPVLDCMHGSE